MDAPAPPSPERKGAPYLFHGQTTSLCETCLELVPAKVIIEDDTVYYLKRCRAHGVQKTPISDDTDCATERPSRRLHHCCRAN